MASDEYLNLTAAAHYLGISQIKVRRLVATGVLQVSRDALDDRKKLVKKDDLDALRTPRPIPPKDSAARKKGSKK